MSIPQGGGATRTFVLVHGAWHGGWCWRRVSERLLAAGHRVFSPTLTGLADRAHLLTPEVNLMTHVQDVVGLIQSEELEDVVLCGHSYGGMVITGVAEWTLPALAAVTLTRAGDPTWTGVAGPASATFRLLVVA